MTILLEPASVILSLPDSDNMVHGKLCYCQSHGKLTGNIQEKAEKEICDRICVKQTLLKINITNHQYIRGH